MPGAVSIPYRQNTGKRDTTWNTTLHLDQSILHETQLPRCIQPQLNRSSALPQGPYGRSRGDQALFSPGLLKGGNSSEKKTNLEYCPDELTNGQQQDCLRTLNRLQNLKAWHLFFQKFLPDPKTKESGQTR
ncbi:hypothetical protein M752DRAFT_262626 [Aspergillus phoenicis ATCC 13157]|uniref:Uncharacterized protein n=1 Tax=Aspergillus phoenicis ATCC 13157 TaxID=1353007 RepID=A0A370PVV8_ASPPH|nr:hypothetical protein M752DRAFT_262626 [Aspergillus phoenicis ATCC 13157]